MLATCIIGPWHCCSRIYDRKEWSNNHTKGRTTRNDDAARKESENNSYKFLTTANCWRLPPNLLRICINMQNIYAPFCQPYTSRPAVSSWMFACIYLLRISDRNLHSVTNFVAPRRGKFLINLVQLVLGENTGHLVLFRKGVGACCIIQF